MAVTFHETFSISLPNLPAPWRRPTLTDSAVRIPVRQFTDPMCPWAYSFEPALRTLEGRYGDQLVFETVLIGLVSNVEESLARGSSAEGRAQIALRFRRFGMPVTPHVRERVTIWLHPWTDHKVYCPLTNTQALRQDCQSYQLVKSLYSIAHGGYGGTGFGRGTFVDQGGHPLIPFLNTDFIYSAIAQELGLIGAAGLLLVFMLFVVRGMRLALIADDGFSKLAAAGFTFGFALQTFIIVGGILRLIPLTGITLPFVSYGGSSVVSNFVLLAGLLLISNRANAPRA